LCFSFGGKSHSIQSVEPRQDSRFDDGRDGSARTTTVFKAPVTFRQFRGALHAEKYYRTVSEEFASTRQAYKWRHLVGLARVSASAFGFPAPGYADACRLLKV